MLTLLTHYPLPSYYPGPCAKPESPSYHGRKAQVSPTVNHATIISAASRAWQPPDQCWTLHPRQQRDGHPADQPRRHHWVRYALVGGK
ncbi:hypothetical protein IF1G_09040 [Cordyceps javanica]|uniref:Uncharacterized protein n=1 Tax=Cordyceps javanica TaxID=43265 RepID=A0A545UST8_9HYPO|nr:hypothetical protein IF1G_09040 [Cordyceps javanica]